MAETKYIKSGAHISHCGKYRYRLWREWRGHGTSETWEMWTDDSGKPVLDGAGVQLGDPKTVVFVMLNPSTADANEDDPTIRRCVGFAKSWGYDRMEVVNLFAYRATNPKELLALGHDDDPCGSNNQHHIGCAIYEAALIVCAWGAHGGHLGQNETVLGWIQSEGVDAPITALRLTAAGHPAHPLYLPANLKPVPFA